MEEHIEYISVPEPKIGSLCLDDCDELAELEQRPQSHNFDLHNDITQQIKAQERAYVPKEWVHEKLQKIKISSTLNVNTHIVPESVKVSGNIVSAEIVSSNHKSTRMEFIFSQGGIVKLNCINPGNPSKFSFELVDKPANLTPDDVSNNVKITEHSFEVTMTDAQARLVAEFNPFCVKIVSTKNNANEVLLEVNGSKSLNFDENLAADFTFHTEHLFGLPERATNLLLEDTRMDLPYRFYNQDLPAFPVGSKNNTYATVPIIISRSKKSPTFVTMYWQNCSDTYIDIHKHDALTKAFWVSERGNFETYIMINHNNADHFRSFGNLFGHCAMPQYFSLGYHQCRWSYKDQKDTLEVNSKFNEYEIPCDTITLDIDHTDGCRYFTWNSVLFPDPVAMQEQLASDGRQLVTIADPHIKVDPEYHVYIEAATNGLYVKKNDGHPFVGKCWPGDSIYLDFLNEETRECWASQYRYDKYKHSTPNVWAWNDMNEPSVFELKGNHMPIDNIHTYKSIETGVTFEVEHREVHNIYGYCHHKATYAGMVRRNADQNIRPHILTRSFYAGSQKYTTIWTGDTGATWEFLQITVPQLLALSLCGFSNTGGDVGGFMGNPEIELAIRWYQLGQFMPFFRAHSETTTDRREPWLYEKKYCDIIKETIKERYRLLPYWYTAFEEHCRTAVPVLRPIWFDQEQVIDPESMKEQERFFVGDAILVVPIVQPKKMTVQCPTKGLDGRWYDYYSKKEMIGIEEVDCGLERIGCFVKGGHIIPTFDIRSYVKSSKDARESNINLYVALNEKNEARGKLYVDDGETFNYKKGQFVTKTFEFKDKVLSWNGEKRENDYNFENRVTKVIIAGLEGKVDTAYIVEGETKKRIQVTKGENHITLEFVAVASKNWKIVLE